MKICLVSFEYPPQTGWGGIGTQTRNKARGLSARGHDVTVISAGFNGASTQRDGGAVVHRIPAPVLDPLDYDGPALWLSWSVAVARKLRELQNEAQFDLVQVPEYGAEGFIYQIEQNQHRRAKVSLQLHGPVTMFADHSGWPPPGSGWYQTASFLERTVMQRSDLVIASSQNIANFCARKHDYPAQKIHVIHTGVDTDRFAPRTQPADARGPRILFVGKPSRSKGFPALVDAVLDLRKAFPRIMLRAVGKITEDETAAKLTKKIAAANAQENFDFRGNAPHDELPPHYAWSDLVAGPSVFEPGAANVYIEAMSCGKPVVACNTGGTPEAVVDGETGILVAPESVDALRKAIADLSVDPALRSRLGANAREWVLSRFSIEKYLDRVEMLYRQVVETK